MSLQKRGSIWWIRLFRNGKRIQQSTKTSNKENASRLHDELKVNLWNKEFFKEKPKYTWKQAVSRWIKESTYKRTLNQDILQFKWLDQHINLDKLIDINKDKINQIIEIKQKNNVKPATINRLLALIRVVLRKDNKEWEWIETIPSIKGLKEPSHRIRWLTQQEAKQLLQELPCHLRDMAAFSLYTGLRKANVFNLKWNQIDFNRSHLTISANDFKTGKILGIPLQSGAINILKNQVDKHQEYVFTYKNQPIKEYKTAWKKALKRLDIKDFKWHDLRHTYASWLVMEGVPIDTIKQLLGHKNIITTLRYAHLSSEHLKKASQQIELSV